MKRLLLVATLLGAGCLLVWASSSRAWTARGPWVYYPLGNPSGGGLGISAWTTTAAWFMAFGILVALLSSIRVSRAWFAIALVGLPVFLYGTLFGFLESFIWEPQSAPSAFPPFVEHPLNTPYQVVPGVLPLGLGVGMGAVLVGLIGARAMLGRFESRQLEGAVDPMT